MSQYPSDQQPTGAPPASNPGQVLGIVSIVLGVTTCLSAVGIVLGIMSRSRSRQAGASTTLGTVGLVISIVVTVIVLIFLVLGAIGAAAFPWEQFTQGIEQCEQGATTYEVNGETLPCP